MEIYILRQMDAAGRLVIPRDIRKMLSLCPGDLVKITLEDGRIVIRKVQVEP